MNTVASTLTRRVFLRQAAAAAATTTPLLAATNQVANLLGAEEVAAPSRLDPEAPALRVTLFEADGQPLEALRQKTLHARDLANDPLPQPIASAPGRVRVGLAKEPLQISVRLAVPGFGEVYCYLDNEGRGYSKPGTVDAVIEAAKTRLQRVRTAAEAARQAGVPKDPEVERRLEGAARTLPQGSEATRRAAAYAALADGLHAGERIALNAARHRISRLPAPRRDFLFGAMASGWHLGGEYEKRFTAAFNFATLSWYAWKNEQPVEQRIDYARQDASLQWCLDRKIIPKGFGYVYLTRGATPEWLRTWAHEPVRAEYRRVVAQTLRRYAGRMPYVEVINEAHDKANLFRFTQAQILELTREACQAARSGAPDVKRLINHCCLWGEYAKRAHPDGSRRWTPFRYLADCRTAGVEYERVGLQLYYPQQDVLEIERMLDRFKAFGRPIHITEIAANSKDGLDPASMRPQSLVPGWHGPWNEGQQADWLEAMYTLCYSKPEFEAVGWWDLADLGGHFWPAGGLLRKDLTPKEAYHRLLQLQQKWGVGPTTGK